jgi:hypothetical protein
MACTHAHHCVSSTDIDMLQLVSCWTDTSAFYLYLVTLKTKIEFYMHITIEAGMAWKLFNTVDPSWQHHSVSSTDNIDMLSTSSELDRHIRMLSSSCDSEVDFDMQITIEAGPECTLFNTAGMHAL